MKTAPVTANGFQLTRLGLVNCYLVRESDGFTLVDTGLSGSGDSILAAARALGTPIRRILLTHAHIDHVGSVDELVSKQGAQSVELAANARSLPLLQKPPDKSLRPGEPTGKVKGGFPGIDARPTRSIAGGELYGSLRAIETPGHTPGHLSFLDERDGTVYAGDALVSVGRLAVGGFAPWFFPLPNMATWNKALAIDSARRLLDFPVERFACGHGKVRSGGSGVLHTAISDSRG